MAEVYAIAFPNGKLYVGKTVRTAERRFRGHARSAHDGKGFAVHAAIRKYGSGTIRLIVLERGLSARKAKELEITWIARLETDNPRNGYNLTKGGDGVCGSVQRAKSLKRWQDPKYRTKMLRVIRRAAKNSAKVRRGQKQTGDRLRKTRIAQAKAVEIITKRWATDPDYREKMLTVIDKNAKLTRKS